jgi:hypothetical protein
MDRQLPVRWREVNIVLSHAHDALRTALYARSTTNEVLRARDDAALLYLLRNRSVELSTQDDGNRKPGHVSPGFLQLSGMPAGIDVPILQSHIGCRSTPLIQLKRKRRPKPPFL